VSVKRAEDSHCDTAGHVPDVMFAVVEFEECTRNAFTGRTSPRFLVVPSNKVHNYYYKLKYAIILEY